MSTLVLIRGVSGSGKTTKARYYANMGFKHIETDMYFYTLFGIIPIFFYWFRPKMLRKAHGWCQRKVYRWLYEGKDVVVANTFTQRWELQPYIDMADEFGIDVTIITATGRYANAHNVPDSVIQKQLERWED